MNGADINVIRVLAIALTAGLLIGMERGWQYRESPPGSRVSGFRTFGLIGLSGGVAGLLPMPLMVILAGGVAATLVAGYLRSTEHDKNVSVTNTIVGLLTFGLGIAATLGFGIQVLAAAAVTTLLLSMRHQLHGWLKGMSAAEIEAIARFALIALVILPLLPDSAMGPYDALNPRKIWLVVVLVSGLSFTGYVLSRRIGPERGFLITAACGAIVSSTAVTIAFARKLKADVPGEGALIAGIAIASLIMFIRVMLLTAVLMPSVLPSLALAMVPATITAIVFVALALRRTDDGHHGGDMKLGNPLDFIPALILGAMVAGLTVAVRWAETQFGDTGIAILLSIMGLADVDAAVLSMSGLPAGTLSPRDAGLILAGPVLVNTACKGVLTLIIAPGRKGWRAALPLFASVAASGAGLAFLAG
ncbi:MAG: MgtC/SapB family protein [Alphaproteobacteria bacterium]|nr:MgtC/SapB family protein [Alphaproteobacteria bacterium]